MCDNLPEMKLALFLLVAAPLLAGDSPCLKPDSSCTQKAPVGGGRHLLVYRNYALDKPAPQVTRAFILVHGAARNGDGYFASALGTAVAAGKLIETMVIAPSYKGRARGCNDPVEDGELYFGCGEWNAGYFAINSPAGQKISSFAAMDKLLEMLSNKNNFPNLKEIVLAGHSAGGQFTQRYAAVNRMEAKLGVPVHYIVANPSSYAYLSDARPGRGNVCTPDGKCTAAFGPYWDSDSCTGYNTYRYGLEKLEGEASVTGAEQMRAQFPKRRVTYLIGDLDTLPDTDLDKSCPANAQGLNRRERGLNFHGYLKSSFGAATHSFVMVPRCGHNNACMFVSSAKLLLP